MCNSKSSRDLETIEDIIEALPKTNIKSIEIDWEIYNLCPNDTVLVPTLEVEYFEPSVVTSGTTTSGSGVDIDFTVDQVINNTSASTNDSTNTNTNSNTNTNTLP
jgi:hypothetical protein